MGPTLATPAETVTFPLRHYGVGRARVTQRHPPDVAPRDGDRDSPWGRTALVTLPRCPWCHRHQFTGGSAAKGRGLKPHHPSQCCPHQAALVTGAPGPQHHIPDDHGGPPPAPRAAPHVAPRSTQPSVGWLRGRSLCTVRGHPQHRGVPARRAQPGRTQLSASPEVSPRPPFPWPSPRAADLAPCPHGGFPKSPHGLHPPASHPHPVPLACQHRAQPDPRASPYGACMTGPVAKN